MNQSRMEMTSTNHVRSDLISLTVVTMDFVLGLHLN